MSHTTAAAAMKDAVKTLIVVDLKAVLKDNKQTISGSKAVLQYRLIECKAEHIPGVETFSRAAVH